jgi:hypothetical protein
MEWVMPNERPNRLFTILIWVGLLTLAWSLPVLDLVTRHQAKRDLETSRYYQAAPASQFSLEQRGERPASARTGTNTRPSIRG